MIVVGSHRRCLLGSQRLSLVRGVSRLLEALFARSQRTAFAQWPNRHHDRVHPVRARWHGRNASWRAERRFQRGNSPVGHPVQKARRCASASSSRLSRRATRTPRRSCRILHDELAERQRVKPGAPSHHRRERFDRSIAAVSRVTHGGRTWSCRISRSPSHSRLELHDVRDPRVFGLALTRT